MNSCLHSHFVTYKVGMSGECQQCATGEEKSHPSYAPNVAARLIRQSDYVLRYAKLGRSRRNLTGCYAGQHPPNPHPTGPLHPRDATG